MTAELRGRMGGTCDETRGLAEACMNMSYSYCSFSFSNAQQTRLERDMGCRLYLEVWFSSAHKRNRSCLQRALNATNMELSITVLRELSLRKIG